TLPICSLTREQEWIAGSKGPGRIPPWRQPLHWQAVCRSCHSQPHRAGRQLFPTDSPRSAWCVELLRALVSPGTVATALGTVSEKIVSPPVLSISPSLLVNELTGIDKIDSFQYTSSLERRAFWGGVSPSSVVE